MLYPLAEEISQNEFSLDIKSPIGLCSSNLYKFYNNLIISYKRLYK